MNVMLTRREMLLLLSYATLEVSGSLATRAFGTEQDLRLALKQLVKRPEMKPLKTAGEIYLKTEPDMNDIEAILESLPTADAIDEAYWERLSEITRSDFDEGRTVSLEDWVFSQTECRLFGLLHLLSV